MAQYPLQEFVQATANASGRAIVSKGPGKFGESWEVTTLAASSTSILESQLRVYRGVESDSAQVASTYSGNSDTAGGNTIQVPGQDKLVFVWSGCTPGATCTCRIEGTLNSRRP
jgi:hypothetical protein